MERSTYLESNFAAKRVRERNVHDTLVRRPRAAPDCILAGIVEKARAVNRAPHSLALECVCFKNITEKERHVQESKDGERVMGCQEGTQCAQARVPW